MVEESGRFSVGGIRVSEVGKLLFVGMIFAGLKMHCEGEETINRQARRPSYDKRAHNGILFKG